MIKHFTDVSLRESVRETKIKDSGFILALFKHQIFLIFLILLLEGKGESCYGLKKQKEIPPNTHTDSNSIPRYIPERAENRYLNRVTQMFTAVLSAIAKKFKRLMDKHSVVSMQGSTVSH